MPRRRAGPRTETPPGDSVDRVVAEWAAREPGLPVAPIEIILRLGRLRARMDDELAGLFARFDLTAADFTFIAALRRCGAPYTLPQSALTGRLGLTSGTVSVRLNRLEGKGVVTRRPSEEDGRGVLVTLTEVGRRLFDRVAPEHLANEDILLSALTGAERAQLTELLRKLLISVEHEQSHCVLGCTVAPARVTRRARTAVGLSDRAGLLIQHVTTGSAAEEACLQPGDVLVGLDGRPLHCCVELASALATGRTLHLRVLRGEDERDVQIAPVAGSSMPT